MQNKTEIPPEVVIVAREALTWSKWATVFRCATISFFSAAASALLFLILEVGNPTSMLAWLFGATIVMFICLVAVKFCELKVGEILERPGDDDE